MKLKVVAISMSLLGLITLPAFANQTIQKKVVHQTTHEVTTVPVQAAPVVVETTEPKVDEYQTILDDMFQNTGRAKPMPDWFNRIGVSGGANMDVKWGNLNPFYDTENDNRFSLNDIYLNLDGTVNDWVKGFMSLDFSNPSSNYSQVYTPYNTVNLEQGYITIGNFDVSPFFLQAGKQFQNFGKYTIHPLNRTLAQALSESLQTSINLGFITKLGLHGSIYAFSSPVYQTPTTGGSVSTYPTVYGASLGFDQSSDQFGYDAGIGYMSNMAGVNDVAYFISNPQNPSAPSPAYLNHAVGAIALYADINSGPFSLGARYTTALQNFSNQNVNVNPSITLGTGNGAKPWAADITAGLGFNAMSRNQNLYVGYQASQDTESLFLPRARILAGYNIDVWKYTNIGAEYTHDYAYAKHNGGVGHSTNTFGVRAAVKFG